MSIPTQPPIRVAAPPVQARPPAPRTPGLRYATVVIAAADSLHPEDADVVCPGVDDDQTISKVVDSLAKGSVELMEGSFHFSNDVFAFNPELEMRGQGRATQVIGGGFILQAQSRISNLLIRDLREDGETGVYLSDEGSACEGVWFSGFFPNGAIYMANANSKACGNTIVNVTGCSDAVIYSSMYDQIVSNNLIVSTQAAQYLIYLAQDLATCVGNIVAGSNADWGIYAAGDYQQVVANTLPGGGSTWSPTGFNVGNLSTFRQGCIAAYGSNCGIGFNALNGLPVQDFGSANQIGFNS